MIQGFQLKGGAEYELWTATWRPERLISQRLFGLSRGINTLIAYGIAKHKMNVKGWRNNKKGEEERGWKWFGLQLQQSRNIELPEALQGHSHWYECYF